MSRRIVLFGGTFDPVTTGHMVVADQAQRMLTPDELWFLVVNVPGERRAVRAPADVRLEMVRAATAGDPRFIVSDLEIRRGGVTYTAETMDELHRMRPGDEFALLVGADSARSVGAWRDGGRLLQRERFVIVNRTGEAPFTMQEAAAAGYDPQRTRLLEIASPRVSASEVRRRVARGQSLDGCVPDAVAAVIRREGLYAGRPSPA